MPFYTVCATDKLRTMKPCAMIFAQTLHVAQLRMEELKRQGSFAFLPSEARLSLRLSSRRECFLYHEWMTQGNDAPLPLSDPGRISRTLRLETAFGERMWREKLA